VEQRAFPGNPMTLDLSHGHMSDVHHNRKMGLYRLFFYFFPPLLRLSKQSTQAVHVLKNNYSYGLFQLVGSGMGKGPSCKCNMGTMILVFNMH